MASERTAITMYVSNDWNNNATNVLMPKIKAKLSSCKRLATVALENSERGKEIIGNQSLNYMNIVFER